MIEYKLMNNEINGQYERARLDKVRADREQLELDCAKVY